MWTPATHKSSSSLTCHQATYIRDDQLLHRGQLILDGYPRYFSLWNLKCCVKISQIQVISVTLSFTWGVWNLEGFSTHGTLQAGFGKVSESSLRSLHISFFEEKLIFQLEWSMYNFNEQRNRNSLVKEFENSEINCKFFFVASPLCFSSFKNRIKGI